MGASAGDDGQRVLTNTVTSSRPPACEVIKAGEQAAKTIDGKVINGTSITSTHHRLDQGERTPVDTWSVKLQPEEDPIWRRRW
jgi:hypothetical protein